MYIIFELVVKAQSTHVYDDVVYTAKLNSNLEWYVMRMRKYFVISIDKQPENVCTLCTHVCTSRH